ncbi:MerR HTH family regulatory protein [Actinopolyspora mzabensis]|uniref:MerR HTH family regulatory protein n=1 Tax=Actinopolyspora mzabensis TaxID=995066 RepID=A0A1G8WTN5_ACTMZ|nr:MerR family transcriptional regulator [Actinopolyspora mzabensis]SDJ80960.1 MerR HTH family regulatory protein [Actinopolyspora mzabensis]
MTTTKQRERDELFDQFQRVEELEEVAEQASAQLDPTQLERLRSVARRTLAGIKPVRVSLASELLDLDEKTIRSWTEEGVLTEADTASTRRLLDPERLHEVLHIVRELRASGKRADLLDAVWWKLSDQAVLDREDLADSLAEMRSGDVHKA